jgi:hypothetical protein
MQMKNPREIAKQYIVVFVGPVRDCANHLLSVFNNIKTIGELFRDYSCVFVENDSIDNSMEILSKSNEILRNVNIISLGKLSERIHSRTMRIAAARNAGVIFCEENRLFDTHEYYISINMDNANSDPINEEDFLSCFKYDVDSWGMMTANQTNYYDIWCLRCKDWVENDCWYKIHNKPSFMSYEEAHKIHVRSKFLQIPKDYGLIEVDAAYGGLSLCKSLLVKGSRHRGVNENQTAEECDLVNFCTDIKKKGGKIFINSELMNMNNIVNEHDVPFMG